MAAKLTTASFTGSIKNLLSGVGMQVLPRHRNRTMPKPAVLPKPLVSGELGGLEA